MVEEGVAKIVYVRMARALCQLLGDDDIFNQIEDKVPEDGRSR